MAAHSWLFSESNVGEHMQCWLEAVVFKVFDAAVLVCAWFLVAMVSVTLISWVSLTHAPTRSLPQAYTDPSFVAPEMSIRRPLTYKEEQKSSDFKVRFVFAPSPALQTLMD